MKSGMSAEGAQASANAFLKTIMKGKQSFHDLYTGIETDLGPLAKVMSENFQGPEEAFRLLEKSPHEFVLKMHKATNALGKLAEKQVLQQYDVKDASQLSTKQRTEYDAKVRAQQLTYTQRFSTQMSKLVGSDMTTLIMKNSDKTMKKMDQLGKNFDKVGGKKGAISKITKQYRDGRTATERFAIAQDLLITRMKKLRGTMSDTRFLGDYAKSSGLVLSKMKQMADKGGPVGKAMTTMIDFSNFGLCGVLARLHPMGLGLTTIVQKFAPVLAMLPALAVGFSALFSPLTLVAVAIGGIYLALKYPEQAAKAFKKFSSAVKTYLPKILNTAKMIVIGVAKALAKVFVYIWENVDWAKVWSIMVTVAQTLAEVVVYIWKSINWGAVAKAIKWAAQKIGQVLKWALLKVIQISDWLIYSFSKIDFETIRGYLAVGFKYAFHALLLAAGYAITRLPYLLKGAFKVMYAVIFGFFDGIRDFFAEQFPQFTKFFTVMFATVKYAFAALATYMIGRWVAMKIIAIKSAISTWYLEKKLWIKKEYLARKTQIRKAAGYVWEKSRDTAKFLWKIAYSSNWSLFEIGKILIVKAAWLLYYSAILLGAVPVFAALIAGTVAWAAGQLVALVAGKIAWVAMWAAALFPITAIVLAVAAVVAAVYMIIKHWGKIVKFFKDIGKALWGIVKKIGKALLWWFTWPIKLLKKAWNAVKGYFKSVGNFIGGVVSSIVGKAKSVVNSAVGFVTGGLVEFGPPMIALSATVEKAGEKTVKAFAGMTKEIRKNTENAVKTQELEAGKLATSLKGVVGGVKKYSKTAADAVIGHVKRTADEANKHWKMIFRPSMFDGALSDVELIMKKYEGLNRIIGGRTRGVNQGKRTREAAKEMSAMESAYLKKHGSMLSTDIQVTERKTKMFMLSKEQLQKMTKADRTYFEGKRKQLVQTAATDIHQLWRASNAGEIAGAENKKRSKEIRAAATAARKQQVLEMAYAAGGLKGLAETVKKVYGDFVSQSVKTSTLMSVHIGRYVVQSRAALIGLTGDIRSRAEAGLKILQKAHAAEIAGIKAKGLTLKKYKAALISLDKKYADASQKIGEAATAGRKKMGKGLMDKKDVLKDLDEMIAMYKKKVGGLATASYKEITSAAAKQFGTTGREATNFLKAMSGINRSKLVRDLGRIKTAYIKFLKGAAGEGKKLLTKTRTHFKAYQTEFKNLWKSMLDYTKNYTGKIQGVATRFFAALMKSVGTGTTQMAAAGASMIAILTSSFSGFNLLDILTSGGKIRDWGLRVIRGLQSAFAGTNPFDTAIELAARNARAIIGAMASERESKGTVKPITKLSYFQIASESARTKAKGDLINATHAPLWSKKVIDQNEMTNRILEKGFKTLLMLQGSKSQQRAAQAELRAGINLKGAGTDPG